MDFRSLVWLQVPNGILYALGVYGIVQFLKKDKKLSYKVLFSGSLLRPNKGLAIEQINVLKFELVNKGADKPYDIILKNCKTLFDVEISGQSPNNLLIDRKIIDDHSIRIEPLSSTKNKLSTKIVTIQVTFDGKDGDFSIESPLDGVAEIAPPGTQHRIGNYAVLGAGVIAILINLLNKVSENEGLFLFTYAIIAFCFTYFAVQWLRKNEVYMIKWANAWSAS
jgi:hypothetical protein